MKRADWLAYICGLRESNNIHWVGILDIALRRGPKETKSLLKMIRKNDKKISEATWKLANAKKTKDT